MAGERVLKIDQISKRYGDTVALDGLSLEVPSGEVFGFVGRNGAGKTTTMRIALGVLAPDAGVVRWLGVPLTFEARRRIGYMPEERGLYPKMRVAEQLTYLGELHGMTGAEAREAALGWLDRFGLADPRRRTAGAEPGQPAAGPTGRSPRLRAGRARPGRALRGT